MMMQEKNQKVEGYLVNLAFELNNKYKNIVDAGKLSRAINMFKNSSDDFDTIIIKIEKLKEKVISEYIKRISEIDMKKKLKESKTDDLKNNGLSNIEMLARKVDVLREYCSQSNLDWVERTRLFNHLLKDTVSEKQKNLFDVTKYLCTDKNSKTEIFMGIKEKTSNNTLIYSFSENNCAKRVDTNYVKEKLNSGMKIISEKPQEKVALDSMKKANGPSLTSLEVNKRIIGKNIRAGFNIIHNSMNYVTNGFAPKKLSNQILTKIHNQKKARNHVKKKVRKIV